MDYPHKILWDLVTSFIITAYNLLVWIQDQLDYIVPGIAFTRQEANGPNMAGTYVRLHQGSNPLLPASGYGALTTEDDDDKTTDQDDGETLSSQLLYHPTDEQISSPSDNQASNTGDEAVGSLVFGFKQIIAPFGNQNGTNSSRVSENYITENRLGHSLPLSATFENKRKHDIVMNKKCLSPRSNVYASYEDFNKCLSFDDIESPPASLTYAVTYSHRHLDILAQYFRSRSNTSAVVPSGHSLTAPSQFRNYFNTSHAAMLTEAQHRQPNVPPFTNGSAVFEEYKRNVPSYRGYPEGGPVGIENLAGAGLFYTGYRDHVACLDCGGGLGDFRPGDDPLHLHAMYFPYCPRVRRLCTMEYIDKVMRNTDPLNVELRTLFQEDVIKEHLTYLNTFGINGYRIIRLEAVNCWSPNARQLDYSKLFRNLAKLAARHRGEMLHSRIEPGGPSIGANTGIFVPHHIDRPSHRNDEQETEEPDTVAERILCERGYSRDVVCWAIRRLGNSPTATEVLTEMFNSNVHHAVIDTDCKRC